jgi:hypothetical protein
MKTFFFKYSLAIISFLCIVTGLKAQVTVLNAFPVPNGRTGIGPINGAGVVVPDDLLHIHGWLPAPGTIPPVYSEPTLRISLEDMDSHYLGLPFNYTGCPCGVSGLYGQLAMQNDPSPTSIPLHIRYSSFAKKYDFVLTTAYPSNTAFIASSAAGNPFDFDMILSTKNSKSSIRFGTTPTITNTHCVSNPVIGPSDNWLPVDMERMCIAPNGSVGIGTPYPYHDDALHIHRVDNGTTTFVAPLPAIKLSTNSIAPTGPSSSGGDGYQSVRLALAICNGCFGTLVSKMDGILSVNCGDMIFLNDKAVSDSRLIGPGTAGMVTNPVGGAFRFQTRSAFPGSQIEQMTIINNGFVGFKQLIPKDNLHLGDLLTVHSLVSGGSKTFAYNVVRDNSDVKSRLSSSTPSAEIAFTSSGSGEDGTGKITLTAFNGADGGSLTDFTHFQALSLDRDKLSLSMDNTEVFYVKGRGFGGVTTATAPGAYFKDRVYIGTQLPTPYPPTDQLQTSVMLAVNGAILSKEFYIKTSWSDFVFEPDYKLMPLDTLAQWIKRDRHLPDIPTAAEVSKSGIEVGEVSSKLLQKIEELTLYMINLQNENKELKTRIEKLEVAQ